MMGKTTQTTLQLHCATPKALVGATRGYGREKETSQEDARASRYRLLDEREQVREAHEIERIQRELQQQRRLRASTSSTTTTTSNTRRANASSSASRKISPKRVFYDEDSAPPAYDSLYSSQSSTRSKTTVARQRFEPPSPQWTDGEGDELTPELDDTVDHRGYRRVAAVMPIASSEFQAQVLQELHKLKQAQAEDFEAIQKLQREKDNAERKANALEATLRQQTLHKVPPAHAKAARSQSRSPQLAFADLDDGDESAPPQLVLSPKSPSPPLYDVVPRTFYDSESDEQEEDQLDYTDGELSPNSSSNESQRWATMSSLASSRGSSHVAIQRSGSPVFAVRPPQQRRSSFANSQRCSSFREPVGRRPRSPRARSDDESDEDEEDDDAHDGTQRVSRSSSRGRTITRSRSGSQNRLSLSRARSASREDLRRSCAFYEEKQKAQAEESDRQREAQRRLERAACATPPANLLKRQDEAQRKKHEQLQKIAKDRDAELSPTKRARAREVPATTYVPTDAFVTADERGQARKERQLKRSQELMAQAELPTRMRMAKEKEQANAKMLEEAAAAMRVTRMAASLAVSMAVSVKARKKLQEQLDEEERRRQHLRPTPVPNFAHLQSQWEKALSVKKSKHKPTEPQRFFTAREQELEALRAKKEARKQKLAAQEELERRQAVAQQHALLERTKKTHQSSRMDGPKSTKSEELRVKKVQEAIRQQRRQQEQETMETERRELRQKEASRRVTAQVKHGESKRKGDYAGEFVELTAVENMAKEKAKQQREQFREAVQRNKERLVAAVATKPSLMERFAIDLKREEHKKNALEAVVKQVFQKNFKDMKGILTEEEEELARDLVAADEDADDDAEEGGPSNGSKEDRADDEDEEDVNAD